MSELTDTQKHFINHLMLYCSAEKASQATGMDLSTVRGWLRDPYFQMELKWRKAQLAEEILQMLRNGATKAVNTLLAMMESGNDNSKVKAALGMLDHMFKGQDQAELRAKMDEIEKRLGIQ